MTRRRWRRGTTRRLPGAPGGTPPPTTDLIRGLVDEHLGRYEEALDIYINLRSGFPRGTEGWWDAQYRIANNMFLQGKYEEVHRMITNIELARPRFIGGEDLKPRFLDLKRACAHAVD